MKKFPPVTKDKESGLPKKYVAGLSTSTAKARAAHWKKMGKYSDKDPRAYKPAPGDATAKTKPSKYTKRFHKMFGEEIGIVIEGAPEKIEGTNCANCIHWVKESEKPVDKSELNEFGGLKAPNEAYIDMSKHADLVTLPGKANVKIKAYCDHEDIHDFVTERMCCAYWDGEGVKREYKGTSPKMDESIVKVDGKFRLVSKKTGRNLGTYDTKAGAMKRERQVQYFKSLGETMKNESKIAGVLAAMNKARPEPKVGDRVVTIKGGQNTGTVEKIKDNHVYFRSDHSQSSLGGGTHKPLYKTHISNVRLHEEKKVSFGRSGGVMHYNPKTEKSEKDGTANIYDPEKHDKKLSPKGGFAVKKRMDEETELDEAQKKLKPSYWRAEWRLGTQTEVDKNNKKIYDKLAKTDPAKAKAFHNNLMKLRKEEVEQTREGFLDFVKKKKPVNKPKASGAEMRAFFSNLERKTKVAKPQQRGSVYHVHQVAAEEVSLDERIDVNKQKKNAVMRQAGVNAAISGKVPFAGSALQMGRKAAKKLPSKTLAKSYRELPRVAEQQDDYKKTKQSDRDRRLRDRMIHHQNRHVHQASAGAHLEEGKADTSLAAKAKKSGVSLGTLRKVYNRGVAAWNSGHRPGTTPQQWGHARVNSYITKGKTYHTADKDLRRESVDFNEAFKEEFNDEIE